MTNFEMYKGIVDRTNLIKIFGILAEEIFAAIPSDVMSEAKKKKIEAATNAIIPKIVPIYKDSFLSVYRNEFSDEELGKLITFYGPGSTLWSWFNSGDFFSWLRSMIKEVIQKRIEGLDLAILSTKEIQSLAQISLNELIDRLPEEVKAGSVDYIKSDLCRREAALGDRITAEGNRRMAEVYWIALLEKSGITPFDED